MIRLTDLSDMTMLFSVDVKQHNNNNRYQHVFCLQTFCRRALFLQNASNKQTRLEFLFFLQQVATLNISSFQAWNSVIRISCHGRV